MKIDDNVPRYRILEAHPWMSKAIKICSVPLRLTQPLVIELLQKFLPEENISVEDTEDFWQQVRELGLLSKLDKDQWQWRLNPAARQDFLYEFEQENRLLAKQIHTTTLQYWEDLAYPDWDKDEIDLQRAYHTTPSQPAKGANLYWSIYCRARTANRLAVFPVLANLTSSQSHWLEAHEQDLQLYRAAAFYYGESTESKKQAMELLAAILQQDVLAPPPIVIDASFLLGTLKEQEHRDQAAKLYERAIEQKDHLDFTKEEPETQYHLRLTLSKSFSNLASYLQAQGTPQELDKAESFYRHGIQIVSGVEPGYEATQLRGLIGVLQKRGQQEDKITAPSLRISQIENPFRQAFLEKVLADFDENHDIGNLYYGISALNHGQGYEHQRIQIKITPDGSAELEGMYTLTALSALSQLETHLETAPESESGVKFINVESLTPKFTLAFRPRRTRKSERIAIDIDPPLTPGDVLTYRWMATASPGTFATTPEQLKDTPFDSEHAAWEIIVPIKHLKIQVIIPWDQAELPRVRYEVWRIGTWHPPAQQVHTAYRTLLEDDPSRVQCNSARILPDQLQLDLEVNYPWLAMSYALSWEVL